MFNIAVVVFGKKDCLRGGRAVFFYALFLRFVTKNDKHHNSDEYMLFFYKLRTYTYLLSKIYHFPVNRLFYFSFIAPTFFEKSVISEVNLMKKK